MGKKRKGSKRPKASGTKVLRAAPSIAKKGGASPDLINGRAMMTVSILYDEIDNIKRGRGDRGTNYVREYLRDYKQYQSEVTRCLVGCYEVLVECKEGRGETVDPEGIRFVKQTIADEMDAIWHGKGRKKKVQVEAGEEEEEEEEEDAREEEEELPELPKSDWEERFANGEFDLESAEDQNEQQ